MASEAAWTSVAAIVTAAVAGVGSVLSLVTKKKVATSVSSVLTDYKPFIIGGALLVIGLIFFKHFRR
jgi:hypothetical protein